MPPVATVPAANDRGAGRAQCDVDRAAGQRRDRAGPERDRNRVAHADRQRAHLQAQPRGAETDGGGQREPVERGHLADPQRAQARLAGGLRNLERFAAGRSSQAEGGLDALVHNCAVFVGRPSRSRPGSSREASLTWKWAVAVKASRKRRCSGESS